MKVTQEFALEKLRARKFDALVGALEGETLECKRDPYHLDSDAQKLELAKDVSALANASGGLLLIGFATERDPAHADDRVVSAEPFPMERFDPAQYTQIVQAWTWPQVVLEIETFTLPDDPTRGIAAITVPSASGETRPILVVRSVSATGRRVDTLVGYFERIRSNTRHHDVRQIHELIVLGRRHDVLLREEFSAIKADLADLKKQTPSKPPIDEQTLLLRIMRAIAVAGLDLAPHIVLAGVPRVALDLRSLFEARDSRLSKLVSSPPEIREAGFGIDAGSDTKIENGLSRRAVMQGRLLELYRDGVALFALTGDQEGLGWATAKWGIGELAINQLALVEVTYLFTLFLFDVYSEALKPGEEFEVRLQLRSRENSAQRFKLRASRLGGNGRVHEAPGWKHDTRVTSTIDRDTPERVAYCVLMDLYSWFGIEGDLIPYVTTNAAGSRVVDAEGIRSAR